MIKLLLFLLSMIPAICIAESPLSRVDQSLTHIVQRYFPEAKIERADNSYIAKNGTMEFTVHNGSKTGEFFPQTGKEEGPNFKGFILDIRVNDGPYQGAAAVPQELKRPYWATYLMAERVPGHDKHFFIGFSYGGRLDAKFKAEVFEALKNVAK